MPSTVTLQCLSCATTCDVDAARWFPEMRAQRWIVIPAVGYFCAGCIQEVLLPALTAPAAPEREVGERT